MLFLKYYLQIGRVGIFGKFFKQVLGMGYAVGNLKFAGLTGDKDLQFYYIQFIRIGRWDHQSSHFLINWTQQSLHVFLLKKICNKNIEIFF